MSNWCPKWKERNAISKEMMAGKCPKLVGVFDHRFRNY